jgi:hypothetical protein
MYVNITEKVTTEKIISTIREYDAKGAALYAFIVITWYAIGVALFVACQIKRKLNFGKTKSKSFLHSIESHIKTKAILGKTNFQKTNKQSIEKAKM